MMMKFSPLLAACLLFTGCSTLVVAPHATRCDVSAELSAYKCTDPSKIPDGATFSSLVDVSRTDRQSLVECGISLNALRDSLNRCNQAIDEYNQKVDQANTRNKQN